MNKNVSRISICELSDMLIKAQGQIVDIDGRPLSISCLMKDVGLTRRAYYGLWDLHKRTEKITAIKIAVAFELTESQLEMLMSYCGYIYPHDRTDDIIQDFFIEGNYDFKEIDQKLEENGELPLFSKLTAIRDEEMKKLIS